MKCKAMMELQLHKHRHAELENTMSEGKIIAHKSICPKHWDTHVHLFGAIATKETN